MKKLNNMIEFGGVVYYIDVDALQKILIDKKHKPTDIVTTIETKSVTNEEGKVVGAETIESKRERGIEIDAVKYDTIRMLLETIIDYNEDIDDTMGSERGLGKTNLPFKIAFNTLFHYGIIKEKE